MAGGSRRVGARRPKRRRRRPGAGRGGGKQKTSRLRIAPDRAPAPVVIDGDATLIVTRRPRADTGAEASLILIAHPWNRSLGARFRLQRGSAAVLGRAASVDISMPEVNSLSRKHARFTYRGESVVIEDLGSTNGTFVNDNRIEAATVLRSGDRFQAGAAHFKFLQERDIESAYHQTIHDLVVRDGLTQIANRRRFEEEAAREFGRARRYGRPLSLILFDIDRFKDINDAYGHLCGDSVLKKVVELTRLQLRSEQLFARVGGEEFVILCPEGEAESAGMLAERVRSELASHVFAHAAATFTVTCSFGIASLGEKIATVEELYETADRALYRSKNAGRNTVTVWQEAPQPKS